MPAEPPLAPSDVRYRCAPCDRYYAPYEPDRVYVREGGDFLLKCPRCGMAVREERSRVVRPFVPLLLGALAYPFKKESLSALLAMGIFGTLCSYLAPMVGFGLGFGIASIYLLDCIRATGEGKDEPPLASDYVEATDLVRPVFRLCIVGAIAFAPAALFAIAGAAPLAVVWLVLGALYLPGGAIVAAHGTGWLTGANVPRAVAVAVRTGKSYFVTALAVVLLLPIAWAALGGAYALMIWGGTIVPILPRLFFHTASLVVPMIMARMVGLLVREHVPELMES